MRGLLANFVLGIAALFATCVNAGDKSMDGKFHRMKKVALVDQHGFEKPLPAISMLIPSDWKFESNVAYPKGRPCGDMVKFSFRATSPDGKVAMELFPAYIWQWADDPQSRQMMQAGNQQGQRFGKAGCDLMQPMHAADFVSKMMAPKVRPGARVLNVEPVPGANELLQKQIQQEMAMNQQYGVKMRVSADSARAKVAYEKDGVAVEEWLSAVVKVHARPMPVYAGGQMRQSVSYNAEARLLFSMRAPAGQLEANDKLFQLIVSTMSIEPDWQGRIAQIQGNIAAIERKGAADRQKIVAQTQQDVNRIHNEGVAHQQAVQEQSHQQFSQYLRGVETYRDPNSGERVELSNQYGHAWSNGAGEYVLSESPGFDPNAHLNGNWTRMQQVKPQ
jgi:hypothetical protein